MEFQVKTTLGQKEILAYQKVTARTVQKVKMNLLHWGLIVVGLLGLTASGAAIGTRVGGSGGILGVVLSAICFVWGINWYRYLVWKVARKIPPDFQQEFLFGAEGMIAQTSVEKVSHRYTAFYAIAESREYYVLFLAKGVGYILDKENFLTGQAEDFGAYIQEKTGKKLAVVRI